MPFQSDSLDLDAIMEEPITIDIDDVDREGMANMRSVRLEPADFDTISLEELEEFLTRLTNAQRDRLLRSVPGYRMLFYVWHEAVSGHLCFSLVSPRHGRLPFSGRIRETHDPAEILGPFLADRRPGFIPWSELVELPIGEVPLIDDSALPDIPVWVTTLP